MGLDDPLPSSCLRPQALAAHVQPQHAELRPVSLVQFGSTDAFWRHNTASRTWWIAHTAIKAARGSAGAFTAEEALKVFADTAVFYHIPMYYNFTREPMILARSCGQSSTRLRASTLRRACTPCSEN